MNHVLTLVMPAWKKCLHKANFSPMSYAEDFNSGIIYLNISIYLTFLCISIKLESNIRQGCVVELISGTT